jgi:hypothetical protein
MSKKMMIEWHHPSEELPDLNGQKSVEVIVACQFGWIATVGYTKYGFCTYDHGGKTEEELNQIGMDDIDAWAYIPERLMTYCMEETEKRGASEDETV